MIASATLDTLRGFARAGLIPAGDAEAILRTMTAEASPEVLLSAKTVANRLGCCTKTVLRLADDGALRRVYLRPGAVKSLRFRASDVARVMQTAGAGSGVAP